MNPGTVAVTSSVSFQKTFAENLPIRFSLRHSVQEILSGEKELERIQNCGKNRSSIPAIALSKSKKPYFMSELCASGVCPYCASKLGAVRLADLEDGIRSFMKMFPYGTLAMMVLTFSHDIADSLETIGIRFYEAKKSFFEQRGVKELLKVLELLGRVGAPETTFSFKSGFHPHEHILFLFGKKVSRELILQARKQLFLYWETACKRFGLTCLFERFYFEEALSSALPKYVSKTAMEITLSDCKKAIVKDGIERYTPFQLVTAYQQTQNEAFADRFREFALFVKGRKRFTWSRGLAELLKVKNYSDEKVMEETDKNRDDLYIHLNKNVFDSFTPDGKVSLLLACDFGNQADSLQHFIQFMDRYNIPEELVSSVEFQNQRLSLADVYRMFRYDQQGRGAV